jgi:hypothetical protein
MDARRGIRAAALCALSVLAACASVPLPQASPKAQDPRQTRIYVLCEADACRGLVPIEIKVDDQSVGDLTSARYLFADRAPGQHVVSVTSYMGYYPVTLTTRAGSVHYLKVGLRPYVERLFTGGIIPSAIEQSSTGHSGQYTLAQMSEVEGRALLQKVTAGPQ